MSVLVINVGALRFVPLGFSPLHRKVFRTKGHLSHPRWRNPQDPPSGRTRCICFKRILDKRGQVDGFQCLEVFPNWCWVGPRLEIDVSGKKYIYTVYVYCKGRPKKGIPL